jgi:trehalose/maltose hydrolase-like predicted phosphorylase
VLFRSDSFLGGTTQEGIHLGVMTGTALFAIRTYAGLNWIGEKLSLNPHLPAGWKKIKFNLDFRGNRYFFNIKQKKVNIKLIGDQPGSIYIVGHEYQLNPGQWKKIKINHKLSDIKDLE